MANPRKPLRHGSLSGYCHYGCRCTECRRAIAEYYKARRRLLKRLPKLQIGGLR